jgi:hypothetical protein
MNVATIPFPVSLVAAATDPLSAAHRAALSKARLQSKRIVKAARVAAFNGWTTAIAAALSAPFAMFDMTGAVVTAGLSIIAYNEFRGRRQLLAFDPSAARLLGWNQLSLLAMVIVYCVWTLYSSLNASSGQLAAELQSYAELDQILGAEGGFQSLYRNVAISMYGGIIALSIFFQGANAFYYFSRERHVEEFVAETPTWARDLLSGMLPA